jgi:hypothetical protein
VHVVGHARPTRGSEVDADVEPVGVIRRFDGPHRVRDRTPQLGVLVGRQRLEVTHLAVRHHEHVTADVREPVEDREGERAPPHDVGLLVGQAAVEDAPEHRRAHAGVGRGDLGDVLAAPARPQAIERHHTLAVMSDASRAMKSSTGTSSSG